MRNASQSQMVAGGLSTIRPGSYTEAKSFRVRPLIKAQYQNIENKRRLDVASNGTKFILPGIQFSEQELLTYQLRINKYRRECGCGIGGVFLVVGASLFTMYAVVTHFYWLRAFPIGLGMTFASAMLGKTIGIGIARTKLIFLQRFLRKRAAISNANRREHV